MTVTNAKLTLTALVMEVERTGIPVCITRNGIPAVVLRKVREGEILLAGEETPTGAETTKRRKPRGKG